MSQLEIAQIELAVHFDYHLQNSFGNQLTEEHRQLRARWNNRPKALPSDTAVFYFSAIDRDFRFNYFDDEVYQAEWTRKRNFQQALGDRFIYIPYPAMPDSVNWQEEFQKREFTYNRSTVRVVAYGEYFEYCVPGFGEQTAHILQIPRTNLSFDYELSVVRRFLSNNPTTTNSS